jgi:hypothetical protein
LVGYSTVYLYLSFEGEIPSPKISIVVITVMVMNGINTINQDITANPLSQRKFNTNENPIIIINFIMASLYMPLNMSITMWVNENTIYKIVGEQKFSNTILYKIK